MGERGDSSEEATFNEVHALRGAGNPIKYRQLLDRLERQLLVREPPKLRVDRYTLDDQLGRGARGVVYRAHDPQLDRDVAIKLLHIPENDDGGSEGLGELIREARAAARLAHPNVVAVFDAGSVPSSSLLSGTRDAEHFADQCGYVVMELVEGETLREWMDRGPQPWRETLRIFLQVGEGLAAAHDKGLVHRDVKPSNIILGEDGRVRVADFGLARWTESKPTTALLREHPIAEGSRSEGSRSEGSRSELSRTGVIAGTPAYMAPEQHAGHSSDPRVDQFGFCASLYEALHGLRPFAGTTSAELEKSARAGRLRRPTSKVRIPASLRRLVRRGLAAEPEQRFASMDELVTALRRTLQPRWPIASAAALALIGAGSIALWLARDSPSSATELLSCDRSAAELIAEVWGPKQSQQLDVAFGGTEQPYATHANKMLQEGLRAYADGWIATRDQACEGTEPSRGRQLRCLEARRQSLSALIAVFSEADAQTIEHAADALARLPPVADCRTDDEKPGDDPLLARSTALRDAGRTSDAELLARARLETDLEPTRRLAWELELATTLLESGQLDPPQAIFEQAYADAEALDDRKSAAIALLGQAHVAMSLGRYEEAESLVRTAEARVDPGARTHELERALIGTRMRLAFLRNDTELGLSQLDALKALIGEDDVASWELTKLRFWIAAADVFQGDIERGALLLDDVIEGHLHFVGPDHPNLINVRMAESWAKGMAGQVHAQLEAAQAADALARRHLARSAPLRIQIEINLARAQRDAGLSFGVAPFEAAVAEAETQLGERSPQLGSALYALSESLLDLGRPLAARPIAERTLSIDRGAYGEGDRSVAIAKILIVRTRLASSDPALDELDALAEAGLEVLAQTSDSAIAPSRARASMVLAEIAFRRGDIERALARIADAIAEVRRFPGLPGFERIILDAVELELELGAHRAALSEVRTVLERLQAGKVDDPRASARAQCLLVRALEANDAEPYEGWVLADELATRLEAQSLRWVAGARCLAMLGRVDPDRARARRLRGLAIAMLDAMDSEPQVREHTLGAP